MAFDDWDPGSGPPFDPRNVGLPVAGSGLGGPSFPGTPARAPRPVDRARPAPTSGGRGGGALDAIELTGQARLAGAAERVPATIRLEGEGFTLEVGGGRPVHAGYRDIALIAINQGTLLLALGDGADAMRWLLDRFGDKIGPLVRELRERRLRQRLEDALVQVPDDPAELVEFDWRPGVAAASGGSPERLPSAGVGQLVVHPWGFVLAPVDERSAWIRYRRALIAEATSPAPGTVVVDGRPGRLELRGLGSASVRWADRLKRLRDGAFDDAARFVEQLLPDAAFGVRQRAGALLLDGQPVRPDQLGDGWETVEAAVLTEPNFAESYKALVSAAGPGAPRWLAMSPEDPGGDEPKTWFLVALPGNLVAMELVSEGSHATYCFRVMPRAGYAGQGADALGEAGEACVLAISEALVDSRFLREPISLPADQLRLPRYLRYRLALAALPSLAEARRRFVGRIVHSSADSWNAAIQNLIAWHATARDETAEWPGRAAQEAQVLAASGEGPEPAAELAVEANPGPG